MLKVYKKNKNHYNCSSLKMTDLLAGTAFGQVFGLKLGVPKPKQKTIKYGLMKKQRITSIKVCESYDNQLIYASDKNVYAGWNQNQFETTVFTNKYNSSKIIGIQPYQDSILIALNNGSLISATRDQQNWTDQEILAPKFQSSLNKGYNKLIFDSENSFCFVGKQALPFLFNFDKNLITWNGKNVPNDELDLRVPINDVDATFFKNKACLACANNDSKVRVYDVRSNKQKPSADYHLKLQKVYTKMNLTRIIVSPQNENTFYISNDLGGVYEMDIRKQMGMVGKFKGINSTVTDLAISGEDLYISSLDSYVRSFSLESREMNQKFYMNKPIYSIYIKEKQGGEQDKEFEEEVLSEQQEEEELNKKEKQQMKKLRKRNKVNLKYLKPVNWDQVPIKEQLLQQAKEQYEQINSKDADSYLDEQQEDYIVKDEHNSDQQRDSDLD